MENASKALIIAGAILISILLISIGIILINSGRDITSTGTSGIQSQKIQAFNSKFTAYEGTKKGSEIRGLIGEVNASNAVDDEHQVQVCTPITDITSAGSLNSTTSYTVSVHYSGTTDITNKGSVIAGPDSVKSEAGYIDYIVISTPTTSTPTV